ncbi:MAG: DUF2298 domain-containing protein [Anaerolineaceae bacterium]|nr:DUF2298 domain-containing protein [Anaerolineaceae bacterium]
MLSFIIWYLLITLTGMLAFPLAFRLFPALPDRGYTLSRALGWLVWGYIFWLLGSLGMLQNDTGGAIAGLVIVALLSAWALTGGRLAQIQTWFRERGRFVWSAEALFLLAFAFLAFVRSANPDIVGTEKPMELAFINAILRSPSFPPHDPWLSGYAISYYYFGYVLVSLLIRLSGVVSGVGFNLGVALLFGLTALGAYGLVYNLIALYRGREETSWKTTSLSLPVLGPLFVLLMSNLEGFLELLHARGWFWSQASDGSWQSTFWKWLNIQELTQAPTLPFSWMPNRPGGIVWWRASRVLGDYNLRGEFTEVIDEFPFFSYLLADMHPHVLAMPFAMLMIGLGLNVYLEHGRRSFSLFGWRIPFAPESFLLSALLLGGLAFLNTWDFPIYVALISGAYALANAQKEGWGWSRLREFLGLAFAFVMCGGILYLPFYLGFSSQAGGILPSMIYFTRGTQFWVMFAPLVIPLGIALVFELRRAHNSWRVFKRGLLIALILMGGLWILMVAFAYVVTLLPNLGGLWLDKLGASGETFGNLLRASLVGFSAPVQGNLPGRLTAPGAWISLAALLALATALLSAHPAGAIEIETDHLEVPPDKAFVKESPPVQAYWLLLVLLGTLLVLGPEFFYLLDQFGSRMNTIFKFYYQAWLIWGIGAAAASAFLLTELRKGLWAWIWRLALIALFGVGLVYPAAMLWIKTNGFRPSNGFTLDGNAYLARDSADTVAAIQWLRDAPPGVIAEASGNQYHDEQNRMATFSGDPDVLGWIQHESQWGRTGQQIGNRPADLDTLYRTNDWNQAAAIIQTYNIRYVVISSIERSQYRVSETKFQRNLTPAFHSDSVTIYEVPQLTPAIGDPGTSIGAK